MEQNNKYATLVEAIHDLETRDYTQNFSITENGLLQGANDDKVYLPSEIELHEVHRFEGNTNPSDMSILYAVQTKSGSKGTVVDAYGVDGSEQVSRFMNKVVQKQYE